MEKNGVHGNIINIGDLSETDMPIRDPVETLTCFIGDPSETDMPGRRPTYMPNWRPTYMPNWRPK